MQLSQLLSIGLFTIALLFTLYFWIDRWNKTNATEAFADLSKLTNLTNQNPSDEEASQAYMTLLKYIKKDFNKGIKFVLDFGDRFFGKSVKIRDDLDVQTLFNNYSNPLQAV